MNTFDSSKTDVWVFGDVHGCADEFQKLIRECVLTSNKRNKEVKFVSLGDLIDRGPDWVQTIGTVIALGDCIDVVMGNHEHSFMAEINGVIDCRSRERQLTHERLRQMNQRDQRKVLDLISNGMHTYLEFLDTTTSKRFLFSHSPFRYMKEYAEASTESSKCVLMNKGNYRNFVSNAMQYDTSILNGIEQDVTMFHGHCSWDYVDIEFQKIKQTEQRAKCYNLDSGCVYGNELIAMCISTEEVVTVKSGFTFKKG